MQEFGRVHAVTKYSDVPRSGIADYDRMPHMFTAVWKSDFKAYDAFSALTPLSDDVFKLAMEDWRIWSRWEAAFHDGLVSLGARQALPEDQERKEQLQMLLVTALVIHPRNSFCAIPTFRRGSPVSWNGKGLGPFEVSWTRTDDAVPFDRLVAPLRTDLNG